MNALNLRHSAQEAKINRRGGGAALSLQIAQCLASTKTHEAGRKLLQEMGLVRGLEEAIRAVATVRAQSKADGSTSQSAWNKVKDAPFYKEGGYRWEASPGGGKAADGSVNGRIIGPPNARRDRNIETRGKRLGESDWDKISSQLDEARRTQLVKKAKARVEEDGKKLEPYEADWLKAMKSGPALKYFECHFDEDEPNRIIAPVSPGEIYCGESSLMHLPQPLSSQSHYKEYLQHLLDKPITDKHAIALRAMFGNQKGVIEQVNDLLAGDADRGNSDNMRDKTYDMLKGLFTLDGGKKYSWMTNAVAAFAGGHQTALSVAAFLLLRGNPAQAATYLQRLPKLALGHNTLLMAIEAAVNGGELNMPVLVQRQVTASQAIRRVAAAPEGHYSQRDRAAFGQNEKRVMVLHTSLGANRLQARWACQAKRTCRRWSLSGCEGRWVASSSVCAQTEDPDSRDEGAEAGSDIQLRAAHCSNITSSAPFSLNETKSRPRG